MLSTAPTFRDPDGSCFIVSGRVYRLVYPDSAERVRTLLKSSFFQGLLVERLFPATRVLTDHEIKTVYETQDLDLEIPPWIPAALLIEHERVEFTSYAHEWSPEMLAAAGELTLKIQLRSLEAGLTLKDASPSNILFKGPTPIFIDLLSFVPRSLGSATWIAYAQFVRTFFLPLLLHREQQTPPHDYFLGHRDGVEPEELYARLSFLAKLKPISLQYVSIPTWLGRRGKAQVASPASPLRYNDERALPIAVMLVKGLHRSFQKVKPPATLQSKWSNYSSENSYQDESFRAKESFVREALIEFAPKRVLDVGCNSGHFSCLAESCGSSVVSIDYDPAVIGMLWNNASAKKLSILPLVMNLARPTPGSGWRNAEQLSFLERAEGHFDVALLLAVVHHLSVTDGIAPSEVFRLIAEFVTKGIVVEFVPPEDSMFRRIIRNKEHLIPKLGQLQFEQSFAPWFTEQKRVRLPHSGRILYRLVRR